MTRWPEKASGGTPENSRRYDLSYRNRRLRSGKPVVAIVGAGRVGSSLGKILRRAGWLIGAVITRSMRTARGARRRIGSGEPQAGVSKAVLAADVILITTPDRAIAETAASLAGFGESKRSAKQRGQSRGSAKKSGRKNWRGKVVLHTSGALGSDVLRPLAIRGAAVGSLHPLQTFSGQDEPALKGATCAVEGSKKALRMARRMCRELGGVPVIVSEGRKGAYHAGAALAAGHVLAVVEAAVRVLAGAGFSRRYATRALLPLTRQTLANYERAGARAAWTGPLSRGDFGVIKRHLEALRPFPREYREAYEALSRLGVKVLANGSRAKRRQLERTLAQGK